MRIQAEKFIEEVTAMEEVAPFSHKDYKLLLGVLMGNKAYLDRVSLEDIAYLMENLQEILDKEYQNDYPEIQLEKCSRCGSMVRRAI